MKIKKSNPARRRSFRARHNCDNPGPSHTKHVTGLAGSGSMKLFELELQLHKIQIPFDVVDDAVYFYAKRSYVLS